MARPRKTDDRRLTVPTSLETATAALNKSYGENFIVRLGDKPKTKVDVISTGSLSLDMALGIGGLPKGRIVEIYGPESSGKTTLALHVIANAQKNGGLCAFIDAEHAFDPEYAKNLGVDIENLFISQPDCGEAALEAVHGLLISDSISVIVVDSVAALIPRAELEGEMGDSLPGLHARLMSQALRKIVGICAKSNTLVIFINQIRMKIGVMYGNPETTTGGNSLKFYASVRLDVRRGEQLKTSAEIIGNKTTVKVIKNKMAPPHKKAEFEILYGYGVNRAGELVDAAVSMGIIEKKGAWFAYGGDNIGQGRENVLSYLRENEGVYSEIETKVMEILYGQ